MVDGKWEMDGKFQLNQSRGWLGRRVAVAEVKPEQGIVDAARKTKGFAFLLLSLHISLSPAPLSDSIQNKNPHNQSKFVSGCFVLLVNVSFWEALWTRR